jgi:hypothetical protein
VQQGREGISSRFVVIVTAYLQIVVCEKRRNVTFFLFFTAFCRYFETIRAGCLKFVVFFVLLHKEEKSAFRTAAVTTNQQKFALQNGGGAQNRQL